MHCKYHWKMRTHMFWGAYNICIYTYIHIYIYVYIYMYICIYVYTYIYTYICIYMHLHVYQILLILVICTDIYTRHFGCKPLTSLHPCYDFDRSSSGCNGFCCSPNFLSGGTKAVRDLETPVPLKVARQEDDHFSQSFGW